MHQQQKSDFTHQLVSNMAESSVHLFPEEVWMNIISFLDVRSKLRVGCTCSVLRRIVQDTSLWTEINLTNQPETETDDEHPSPGRVETNAVQWCFPRDVGKVMQFADCYFTERLKILHLHVVNTNILKYLREICVSLESLTLSDDYMTTRNCDLCYLPSSLKKLDLWLKYYFVHYGTDFVGRYRALQMGDLLGRYRVQRRASVPLLPRLFCLTIRYTALSRHVYKCLSKCISLREITLHHCIRLTRPTYDFDQLAKSIPNLDSIRILESLNDSGDCQLIGTLSFCSFVFKKPKSFKLKLISNKVKWSYATAMWFVEPITNCLLTMGDLRLLWLDIFLNIFLPDHLIQLLSTLRELREVEFISNDSVNTLVLNCLRTNLTHLYRLNLKDCKNVTDTGIKALANHNSLQYLNLQGCNKVSHKTIRDTVLTIDTMQTLVVSKDPLDECVSYLANLKQRIPNLTIHVIFCNDGEQLKSDSDFEKSDPDFESDYMVYESETESEFTTSESESES